MIRRLPIFFLIDVSESMVGEPISKVSEGIGIILAKLRTNPMALETAYLSVLIFAGKAKTQVTLTELLQFQESPLPIGGGTCLGKAMNYLMDEMNRVVVKSTSEMKGDWKPIIFLLTDGAPTDDVNPAILRWNQEYRNKCVLIAISFEGQADTDILKKFTNNVLIFDNIDPKSYSEFFQWISSSIESKSMNVMRGGNDDFELPEADQDFLKKEEESKRKSEKFDDRYIILTSRCQKTKTPYLIKYKKDASGAYHLEGTFRISEEYFTLSEGEKISINSQLLGGEIPQCPSCGNIAMAFCGCGNFFCIADSGKQTCPWCNQASIVDFRDSFDITKAQG